MATILVVNLFGVGNCILSTPTVSALCAMGHVVEVLVMRRKFSAIAFQGWEDIRRLHYDRVPLDTKVQYDLALWTHPLFPGLFHPECPLRTVDPQPWSDKPYHWRFERHEVLTLLELARDLGYRGAPPPLRPPYAQGPRTLPANCVAIGIGYAKMYVWHQKHWGNEAFAAVCRELREAGFTPVLFGDDEDQRTNGWVIEQAAGVLSLCGKRTLPELMAELRGCVGFIGNDTGLMHAAAAYGLPTLGIFRMTDPTKNAPWGARCDHRPATTPPGEIVATFRRLAER